MKLISAVFDREHAEEAGSDVAVHQWLQSTAPYLVIVSMTDHTRFSSAESWTDAFHGVLAACREQAAAGQHSGRWHFRVDPARAAQLKRAMEVMCNHAR